MLRLFARNLDIFNKSIEQPIVAKITSNPATPTVLKKKLFYLYKRTDDLPSGFKGYLFVDQKENIDRQNDQENIVYLPKEFDYLESGDDIKLNPPDSSLRVLYRRNSPNNSFLITEQCNSFCIMCSQPPRDIQDDYRVDEIIQCIPLIDPSTKEIGFSGGEPTLIGDRLVDLVKRFKYHLPNTAIHILTNGRLFSNFGYAQKFEAIDHFDCMFGIPLYSDLPEVHDFIVQANNAYDQTIKGILNLKRSNQKVEIRVVIQKDNYQSLTQLAEFIVRNLIFVDQVVFMGLEPTGFAKVNMAAIWVDPYEYKRQLREAVEVLNQFNVKTKLYNIQLCLLDQSIAHFSVNSISDWKREYADECKDCTRIAQCCGIFGTGTAKHSAHLKAFK